MSRSSAKVEYRTIASTVCELQWISYLLQDFGFLPSLSIPPQCDNHATLHITTNLVFQIVPNIWRLIVTWFKINSSKDLFYLITFLQSFTLQTYSQKLYLLLLFHFCCPSKACLIFTKLQLAGRMYRKLVVKSQLNFSQLAMSFLVCSLLFFSYHFAKFFVYKYSPAYTFLDIENKKLLHFFVVVHITFVSCLHQYQSS